MNNTSPLTSKQPQKSKRMGPKPKVKGHQNPFPFHPVGGNFSDCEFRPDPRRALFRENFPPIDAWNRDPEFEFRRDHNMHHPPRYFPDDSYICRSHPRFLDFDSEVPHRGNHFPDDGYYLRDRRSVDDLSQFYLGPHQQMPYVGQSVGREVGGFVPSRDLNFREPRQRPASGRALPVRPPHFDYDHGAQTPVEGLSRMLEMQSFRERLPDPVFHHSHSQSRIFDGGFRSPEFDRPQRLGQDRKQSPSPRSVYDFVETGHPSRMPIPPQAMYLDKPWCPADSPPHRGYIEIQTSGLQFNGSSSASKVVKSADKSAVSLLPSQEELEAYLGGTCTK